MQISRYLASINKISYNSSYMAKKKAVEKAEETALVVAPPIKNEVVLEGDPDAQLAFAAKAANALMGLVSKKKNPVIIRGKTYLEFGDWQVLARFYGATVEIEWTKELGNNKGYEARARVLRDGQTISSAEGMCTRDERRWKDADDFAVRSMAQTRTAAKALRNAFGWVAELAGYASTPVEEMDGVQRDSGPSVTYRVQPVDDDIAVKKEQIKELLEALQAPCDTLKQAQASVLKFTGMELLEKNYSEIIELLRAKYEENDPLSQVLNNKE